MNVCYVTIEIGSSLFMHQSHFSAHFGRSWYILKAALKCMFKSAFNTHNLMSNLNSKRLFYSLGFWIKNVQEISCIKGNTFLLSLPVLRSYNRKRDAMIIWIPNTWTIFQCLFKWHKWQFCFPFKNWTVFRLHSNTGHFNIRYSEAVQALHHSATGLTSNIKIPD